MAVNARWTNCPAYLKAKTTEKDSEEWGYFNNLSYTLSMALVGCRFPCKDDQDEAEWEITEDNWKEVFIRISIWEHLWGALRLGWKNDEEDEVDTDVQEPTEIYFTPEEIRSMVGLSVNAGTETDEDFGQRIYLEMRRKAQDKLRKYRYDHDEEEAA